MRIRSANHKDKADYLRTQKEAFPTIDSERDARFFDEKVARREAFVVEEDGYAGHLCFGTHTLNPPFIGSVFIEELAIRTEYRGRGFGTALIERLVAHCTEHGIRAIHLGTSADQAPYYERLGFTRVGWLDDIDPESEYDHGQAFYALMVEDWGSRDHERHTSEHAVPTGRYRHYKGGLYTVLGVAHHSETHEELVVYRAEYPSNEFGDRALWVRPKTMFLETVEVEGRQVPRFAFVETSEP